MRLPPLAVLHNTSVEPPFSQVAREASLEGTPHLALWLV